MSDDLHMLWYIRDEDTNHKLAVELISESDGTLMASGKLTRRGQEPKGSGKPDARSIGQRSWLIRGASTAKKMLNDPGAISGQQR